jgi:hypothetical protein
VVLPQKKTSFLQRLMGCAASLENVKKPARASRGDRYGAAPHAHGTSDAGSAAASTQAHRAQPPTTGRPPTGEPPTTGGPAPAQLAAFRALLLAPLQRNAGLPLLPAGPRARQCTPAVTREAAWRAWCDDATDGSDAASLCSCACSESAAPWTMSADDDHCDGRGAGMSPTMRGDIIMF